MLIARKVLNWHCLKLGIQHTCQYNRTTSCYIIFQHKWGVNVEEKQIKGGNRPKPLHSYNTQTAIAYIPPPLTSSHTAVPSWHSKPTAETLQLLSGEEHLTARTSTLALAIVCVGIAYKGSLSHVCSITPFQSLIKENTVTKQQGLHCSKSHDINISDSEKKSIYQYLTNICCFFVSSSFWAS